MNEWIGYVCGIFQQFADFVWDFPTNFDWYRGIPIIGELPFIIIFLVGTGIYFSLKLGFVQIKYFLRGIKNLMTGKSSKRGISPLASFLLSTAMRVGPGNILGVTGAVSTGGPGALFWMWLSAFFGAWQLLLSNQPCRKFIKIVKAMTTSADCPVTDENYSAAQLLSVSP